MPQPLWLDQQLLREVPAEARAAPRKRRNRNFHASDGAACQRLLNAVEPETYIPPHRHLDPAKDETLVVLAGRVGLLLFDESGQVTAQEVLEPGGARLGVTIPAGTFHTLVSLAPGSGFLEAKAGPYRPLTPNERAAWAPGEGGATARDYLAALIGRFA